MLTVSYRDSAIKAIPRIDSLKIALKWYRCLKWENRCENIRIKRLVLTTGAVSITGWRRQGYEINDA
jgi:hypothetical protein